MRRIARAGGSVASLEPNDFRHLDGPGRATAQVSLRTKPVAYGVTLLLVAAAWLMLLTVAVKAPSSGPGAGWQWLPGFLDDDLPAPLASFLSLCIQPVAPGSGFEIYLALLVMWFLMAVAMMLPSAAPLIRTYCEIADTAQAARKPAAHPLWLVSGYLAVWLMASAVFAGANWLMSVHASDSGAMSPAALPAAVLALGLAGAYQFSRLKDACLKKCQNPFATLFANWSTARVAVFQLGIRQGLWCLGCCWALMLVMFAVGIMNVFWMALLALFTLIEKTGSGRGLSRVAGAILLVWAMALLLVSVLP